MPFPILSHQAVVLPLKRRWPALFSGTALAVGAFAPDAEYFIRGDAAGGIGHTSLGALVYSWPTALLLYWVTVVFLIDAVAAHLPAGGPFHFEDYRGLARGPRQWSGNELLLVASSALMGVWSHVLWDAICHQDGGFFLTVDLMGGSIHLGPLGTVHRGAAFETVSTILGALYALWWLAHMGRARTLRGDATPDTQAPARRQASRRSHLGFWTAVLVPGLGAALLAALWHTPATLGDADWWAYAVCQAGRASFVGLLLFAVLWRAGSAGTRTSERGA